ncbi:putative secreted protein [Sorangium cellulosum So ce56]|uniref:Secreted protein n=1 Tax=Sorangium cellulosum (strain So ce56) TaxID=448385 RepID=A9EMX1_SORC5|nr:putative secreted protein [Sorangium cellulosum So ce56]
MRTLGRTLLGTAVAVVLTASGCDGLWYHIENDCESMLTCEKYRGRGSEVVPSGCVPSEIEGAVDDVCGIFVASTGNDDNAGTRAEPVATLAVALRRAAEDGVGVYACAETFEEAVEIPAGAKLFGGLDCANGWTWVGETAKTTVAPGEEGIALKVMRGEDPVRIEDISARAADAQAPGASSIAVLVDGGTAEFARCELVAGNAADGAEGEDAPSDVPAQASPGNAGADACSDLDGTPGPDATLSGGAQVVNECGGELSIGGGGGDGNVTNGTGGDVGASGALGAAGSGEPTAGNWSCASGGTGQGGDNGAAGDAGLAASGLGRLSSLGYAGVSGGPGKAGTPGQGGGGGGGAKGGAAICSGAMPGAGASGGSGGPGGCGGLPGEGGGAGGASIALASVEGKVTLKDCMLKAGNGGKGGAGGDLQPGGLGGLGGVGGVGVSGSKAACAGGQGGQGGNGGPGGGGLGGPSLAIAYRGEAVKQEGQTMLQPGTPGAGGPGGSNNVLENAGAEGTVAAEQEFP